MTWITNLPHSADFGYLEDMQVQIDHNSDYNDAVFNISLNAGPAEEAIQMKM